MVKKRSDGYGILITKRPVRAEGSVFSAKVILFHDISKRYAAFFLPMCRSEGNRVCNSLLPSTYRCICASWLIMPERANRVCGEVGASGCPSSSSV